MSNKLKVLLGLVGVMVVLAVVFIQPGIKLGCAALPPAAIKAMKDKADHLVVIEIDAIECVGVDTGTFDACRVDARVVAARPPKMPLASGEKIAIAVPCRSADGKGEMFAPIGSNYMFYGKDKYDRLLIWLNKTKDGYRSDVWERLN